MRLLGSIVGIDRGIKSEKEYIDRLVLQILSTHLYFWCYLLDFTQHQRVVASTLYDTDHTIVALKRSGDKKFITQLES